MQNSSRLSNAGTMTQSTLTLNLAKSLKVVPQHTKLFCCLVEKTLIFWHWWEPRRLAMSPHTASSHWWPFFCRLFCTRRLSTARSLLVTFLPLPLKPCLCTRNNPQFKFSPWPSFLFLLSGVLSQIIAELSLRNLWPIHLANPTPQILSLYSSSQYLRSSNLPSYLLLEPFPSYSQEPHLFHGSRTHSPLSSSSSETVLCGISGLLKMSEGIYEKSSQEESQKGTSRLTKPRGLIDF